MAFVYADRVRETSPTTGTGTYIFNGAVTGFQTFVSGIGDTNTCYYCATDNVDWEIGIGTVASGPDSMARTAIIASSNSNAAVNWAAGTRDIFCTIAARGIFPPGHIFGLTMSNDGGDTTNDIAVAAGSVRDELDLVDMRLPASITKQIDASWAVGTGAGGMNTGSVANSTWYEVHVIMRPDTGVVDVMFTTTADRATLPTNYVYQRRIGWVRRGTATNLQFTQVDDHFTWTTQVNDASYTPNGTATARTLSAPPSSIVRFRAGINTSSGSVGDGIVVVFSEIVEGGILPAVTTGISSLAFEIGGANFGTTAGQFADLRLSATSTIETDDQLTGTPTMTVDISTYGWIDTRGRLS